MRPLSIGSQLEFLGVEIDFLLLLGFLVVPVLHLQSKKVFELGQVVGVSRGRHRVPRTWRSQIYLVLTILRSLLIEISILLFKRILV